MRGNVRTQFCRDIKGNNSLWDRRLTGIPHLCCCIDFKHCESGLMDVSMTPPHPVLRNPVNVPGTSWHNIVN